MTRLPVSTLLLGTVGATLALTFACGGGGTANETGGASGTGPSVGGAASTAGTPSTSGSAGKAAGGSAGLATGGAGGAPAGGTAGSPAGGMPGGAGAGMAGVAGVAGTSSPAGGTAGTTGGSGAGGSGSFVTCNVMAPSTKSTSIGTVFTVEVTTDLPGFDGGYIEFGLDTNYGYTAPLDMTAMNHKTPLLGMKQSKDYHYRAVVTAGATTKCAGMDQTVTTTTLANGFPRQTTTPATAATLSGDFMIAEFYAGQNQFPFILDKDREMVWTYDPEFDDGGSRCCDSTRARMSIDGKFMWVAHGNVPSKKGLMKKIAMDGSSAMDMSAKFPRLNHDFTIIDDASQTMYFIAYKDDAGTGCDDIVEYDPVMDKTRIVVNMSTFFSDGMCHCNAIQYSPMDDTLVVSELDHSAYVKMDRKTGAKKWILGGGSGVNEFTGDGSSWQKEHNMHLLAPDHFVFFNNGPGAGTSSTAIELQLDEAAKTATKKWTYTPMTKIENAIMGDVQRLANGNTLVAFSTQGIVHEVDATGTLLQTISWGAGGAIGYIIMRPTLYGKPPR